MLKRIATLCVCAIIALAMSSYAHAHAQGRRIALVIGTDAYAALSPLKKAVADARAVAAVLREDLGFAKVIEGLNLDRNSMVLKLADLDDALKPGDLLFFFFAGHGVALGSENVLLPADLTLPRVGQTGVVRDLGFPVDDLIRRFKGRGVATAMLVLDACRDNPFGELGVRSIGVERGLTRIDAPHGVFVLFSAGLGQKALDRLPGKDATETSVFTRHLLPALKTPGLSHVQIAKLVQKQVDKVAREGADHAQQPAYYDQIVGEIVLKTRAASESLSPTASQFRLPGVETGDLEPVELRKWASGGDPNAITRLGYLYHTGRGGLPQNYAEAVRFYRAAADKGIAVAMTNLGLIYGHGRGGLGLDDAEAVGLYRAAAETGYAEAMTNLGFMYERGRGGLRQDDVEAVRLYRAAAALGEAVAMKNLASMYERQRGGVGLDGLDDAEAARLLVAALMGNDRTLLKFYETTANVHTPSIRAALITQLRQDGYYNGPTTDAITPDVLAAMRLVMDPK